MTVGNGAAGAGGSTLKSMGKMGVMMEKTWKKTWKNEKQMGEIHGKNPWESNLLISSSEFSGTFF